MLNFSGYLPNRPIYSPSFGGGAPTLSTSVLRGEALVHTLQEALREGRVKHTGQILNIQGIPNYGFEISQSSPVYFLLESRTSSIGNGQYHRLTSSNPRWELLVWESDRIQFCNPACTSDDFLNVPGLFKQLQDLVEQI